SDDDTHSLDGGRRPQLRMLVFPAAHVEIVDTWNVAGLRGTGSHDLKCERTFCPDEFAFGIDGPSQRDEPIFRIPVVANLGLWVAAVGLGVAHGALGDIVALAIGGKQPTFGQKLAESTLFHDKLGRADAALRGARALLHHQAAAAWEKAALGEEF